MAVNTSVQTDTCHQFDFRVVILFIFHGIMKKCEQPLFHKTDLVALTNTDAVLFYSFVVVYYTTVNTKI